MCALLKAGPLVSEISGRVANVIFSSNLGGAYARTGVIPLNPQSEFQAEVRSVLSYLSKEWSDTLTDAQRTAWEEFSKKNKVQNRLGDSIELTGIAMFCRLNANNSLLCPPGAPVLLDPPSSLNVLPLTKLTVIDAIAATGVVQFDTTPGYSVQANTFVVVRMSPIMRPGATRPAAVRVITSIANGDVNGSDHYQASFDFTRLGTPAVGDRFTLEVQRIDDRRGAVTVPVREIVTFT